MAVVFDAGSNGHAGNPPTGNPDVSNVTYSHTCTGSELALVVGVSIGTSAGNITGNTITCTYNGVSMTEIRSGTATGSPLTAVSTSAGVCLFYLVGPATGANNIIVTSSGPVDYIVSVSVSATGVTSITNGANTTSSGSSNSPTLAITSATNNLAVGVAGHGDTISGAGGVTTQRAIDNFTNQTAGSNMVAGTSPGAATSNIDFTSAVNDTWIMLGLNMTAPEAAVAGLWNSGVRRG